MSESLSSISVNEKKRNESSIVYIIIFLVVAAAFIYILIKDEMVEQTSQNTSIDESEVQITEVVPTVVDEPTEVIEPELVVEEPVAEVVIEEIEVRLPALDDSDALIGDIVAQLSWRKELLDLLLTDDLIRRIVVTADNFAQGELAYSHIPLKEPLGKFQAEHITAQGESYRISDGNHIRYTAFIDLLHSFDPETLIAKYDEVKPLFEEAYAELGYVDKSFDDVLKVCIERVLDMPVPAQSPALVRPNVIYQYQDAELEQLSQADKLLLRIGKENLLQLKAFVLTLSNQFNHIQ